MDSLFTKFGNCFINIKFFPLGVYLYKKINVKNTASNHIKILEIKSINYKAQILLIEVDKKRILLGYSEKGFTYLGEVKDE